MTLITLLALLVVLAVEHYLRWGAEYRNFVWLISWRKTLDKHFSDKPFFSDWAGLAFILLAPILALLVFINLFSGFIYFLVFFVISCAVLFLTLGPKPLESSLNQYFEFKEKDDMHSASLALQSEFSQQGSSNSDVDGSEGDPIRRATHIILRESQLRYFSVIFWFVILGPFGALLYRLTYEYLILCSKQLLSQDENKSSEVTELESDDLVDIDQHQVFEKHLQLLTTITYWLEWLPSRVTAFIFLLVGDFVKSFTVLKKNLFNFSSDNQQLVIQTGIASLGLKAQNDSEKTENNEAVALIKRSFIIYLVLVAILTFLLL